MSAAMLQLLVALLAQIAQQILPALTSDKTSQLVTNGIALLEKLLPDVLAAGEELTTTVQNIIAALKGADGILPDQWNALDAFEKKIDADFDAAAGDEGFAAPDTPSSGG